MGVTIPDVQINTRCDFYPPARTTERVAASEQSHNTEDRQERRSRLRDNGVGEVAGRCATASRVAEVGAPGVVFHRCVSVFAPHYVVGGVDYVVIVKVATTESGAAEVRAPNVV